MILPQDLLSIQFYKKEKFTGSLRGMRYVIQKSAENDSDIFEIYTWPGPYNFASTEEDKKVRKTFPFEENSIKDIAEYLNQTYESGKDSWPTGIF
ncbi:MAG: GNAT family acetyltransferase [Roseburia sp.]|nr:GNAT family acetyltransferase [Roseburia sp.]